MRTALRRCACLLAIGGLAIASELTVVIDGDGQEHLQRSDWARTWYRLQGSPLAEQLAFWQRRREWQALQRGDEAWNELQLHFQPDRPGAAGWRGLLIRGDSDAIARARERVAAAWQPTGPMAFLRPRTDAAATLQLGRPTAAIADLPGDGLRWRWDAWQGRLRLPDGLVAERPADGWTPAAQPPLVDRAPADAFFIAGLATGSQGWQDWLAALPEQELLDQALTAGRHRLPPLRRALAGLRGTACLVLHPGIYQPAWSLILPDSAALRSWLEEAAGGGQAERLAATGDRPMPFALWRGMQTIHLAQTPGYWLIGTDAAALRRWQRPADDAASCPLAAALPAEDLVGWALVDLRRLLSFGEALAYLGRRLDWPLLNELGHLGHRLTATVDSSHSRLLLRAVDGRLRGELDAGSSAVLLGLGFYRHWLAQRRNVDRAGPFRDLCRQLRQDGDWRPAPITVELSGWSMASDPDQADFLYCPWTADCGPPQWQAVVVSHPDRHSPPGSWVAFADDSLAFVPGRAVWQIARDLPHQAPSAAPVWQRCRWRFARVPRFDGGFDED